MQTRYDLVTSYGLIFGLLFLSMILPIPGWFNMTAIPILIFYTAAHQGAQSVRPAQSISTRRGLRKGDIHLIAVGLIAFILLSSILMVIPARLTHFIFQTLLVAFGAWCVVQKTAEVLTFSLTEDQEHQLRQKFVTIPLKNLNKSIKPILQPLADPIHKFTALLHQIPVVKTVQVFELVLIRLLDGAHVGDQQEATNKEIEEFLATAIHHPLPSSTAIGTTCEWSHGDEKIPLMPPTTITVDSINLIAYSTAVAITLLHLITGYWFFNNIIAISIGLYLLQIVSISSAVDGAFILGCFAFAELVTFLTMSSPTSVVTSTAEGIAVNAVKHYAMSNLPLKLVFGGKQLGLGALAPGLLSTLLLRYDINTSKPLKPAAGDKAPPLTQFFHLIGTSGIGISTPHFNSHLITTGLGFLANAIISNATSLSSVPTLLIIIPIILGSSVAVSHLIGNEDEFKKLLAFVDEAAEAAKSPTSSGKTIPIVASLLNAVGSPVVAEAS